MGQGRGGRKGTRCFFHLRLTSLCGMPFVNFCQKSIAAALRGARLPGVSAETLSLANGLAPVCKCERLVSDSRRVMAIAIFLSSL